MGYQETVRFTGETPEMRTISWKLDSECQLISFQEGCWMLLP